MKLEKYDNKCVRLIDTLDNIFEGIVTHNSSDYNYHEYARDEDSLQMGCIIFYKDDIKSIKEIDTFTSEYSKLEEMIVEDGICLIDEILYGEEDIHTIRLLKYINNNLDKIDYKEELKEMLSTYKSDNKEINSLVKIIINKLN